MSKQEDFSWLGAMIKSYSVWPNKNKYQKAVLNGLKKFLYLTQNFYDPTARTPESVDPSYVLEIISWDFYISDPEGLKNLDVLDLEITEESIIEQLEYSFYEERETQRRMKLNPSVKLETPSEHKPVLPPDRQAIQQPKTILKRFQKLDLDPDPTLPKIEPTPKPAIVDPIVLGRPAEGVEGDYISLSNENQSTVITKYTDAYRGNFNFNNIQIIEYSKNKKSLK